MMLSACPEGRSGFLPVENRTNIEVNPGKNPGQSGEDTPDGQLMPTRKDQPPPDLRCFQQTGK